MEMRCAGAPIIIPPWSSADFRSAAPCFFPHIRVGFLRTLADENRISGGHADILYVEALAKTEASAATAEQGEQSETAEQGGGGLGNGYERNIVIATKVSATDSKVIIFGQSQ